MMDVRVKISDTCVKMAALAGKVVVFGASANLCGGRCAKKVYEDEATAVAQLNALPYSWYNAPYEVVKRAADGNLTAALKSCAEGMYKSWQECRKMIKNAPAGSAMEMSQADIAAIDYQMKSLGEEVCCALNEYRAGSLTSSAKLTERSGIEWEKAEINNMPDNVLNDLIEEAHLHQPGESWLYEGNEWKVEMEHGETFLYVREIPCQEQKANANDEGKAAGAKFRATVQMAMVTSREVPAGFVEKCLYEIKENSFRVFDGVKYVPLLSSLGEVKYVSMSKLKMVWVFSEPPAAAEAAKEECTAGIDG